MRAATSAAAEARSFSSFSKAPLLLLLMLPALLMLATVSFVSLLALLLVATLLALLPAAVAPCCGCWYCCPTMARASSSGVVLKSSTYRLPSVDRSLASWALRASSALAKETKASPVMRPSARRTTWMLSSCTLKSAREGKERDE